MNKPASQSNTFVSVVVPLCDAAAGVEQMIRDIDQVLHPLFSHYEIVLVDDGSRDNTVNIVQSLQKQVKNIQLFCLHPRRGFDIALVAGIDNSIGDSVITLNPETDSPSLIPALWAEAQKDHEFVCGIRAGWPSGAGIQSILERAFYRLLYAMTGIRVPLGATDLRLYSRRVANYITQNNDRHLLLKVLPFFISNQAGRVEYPLAKRPTGHAKRNLLFAITSGISILLGSSIRPLRLLTLTALAASSVSLLYAIYVVAIALFKHHVVEGWITLALPMAVMFFFISVILGMLSEYIYILSQQSGNRPVYLVARESTSAVLDIKRKLNVVEDSGRFADRGDC